MHISARPGVRRALSLALVVAGLAACSPPAAPPTTLPSGLQLETLPVAQRKLLRATLAVSDGGLNETDLVLDDNLQVSGSFSINSVTEQRDATMTLRVYGRFDDSDGRAEVLLGELQRPVTLTPREETRIAFSSADAFETCGAGDDGRCSFRFDSNRNGRTNIEDLLPTTSGGRGIDPAPQDAFLIASSSQLQFPSGIRLGSFARQLVVLEAVGENDLAIDSATVVGGQGFSISILDPDGISVNTPSRSLAADSFADAIQPGQEAFIAVSFAPVNTFVTTGVLFVTVRDVVTDVRQTVRVKLIANPEGELRPLGSYTLPEFSSTIAVSSGSITPSAFPADKLFSGEQITADAIDAARGLQSTGAQLVVTLDDGTARAIPADASFVVDVLPQHRFATTLDAAGSDLDLAVLRLDGDVVGGPACVTCVSTNANLSPEAAEFVNTSDAVQRVVVVFGRVDAGAGTASSQASSVREQALSADASFRFGCTITKGPEFDAEQPIDVVTGPLEGGIPVRLRGRGFQPGATVRIDEALGEDVVVGEPAADGTVDIAFTMPAHQGDANPATIVVQNPSPEDGGDGQAATLPEAFTYQPPAPVIDEVRPDLAPTTGGDAPVQITGRFFSNRNGAPRVFFGDVAVDATFVDAATLRVVAPASPTPTSASNVSLKVRNRLSPDQPGTSLDLGSASNGVPFRYVVPQGNAPTVTGVAPPTGSVDGGTDVVITGTDLRAGARAFFGGEEAQCAPPAVDGTTIACRTPASDEDGATDVIVINADGQGGKNGTAFAYTIPAPAIASVFPARGSVDGGTFLVVEGIGFRPGLTVRFEQGGTATPAANVTRVSGTTVLVTTPAGAAGASSLVIRNVDAQEVSATFTYFAPDQASPPPTVLSVAPGTGDAAGGYDVFISGTDFRTPTVVFGTTRITVGDSDFTDGSGDALDVIHVVAPPSPTGVAAVVNVQVINGDDGQSASQPFTYSFVASQAPRIDTITPSLLSIEASHEVTIRGQRFGARARVLFDGVVVPSSQSGASQMSATLPAVAVEGPRLVVIENEDGLSASGAVFFVDGAPGSGVAPRVASISPRDLHASIAGDEIIVVGEGFAQGSLIATFQDVPPGVATAGGFTFPANVKLRTDSVLVLQAPELPSGPVFLHLDFNAPTPIATPSTPPLQAHDPVVYLSESRTLPNGSVQVTVLGDYLNPTALASVTLGAALNCSVLSSTESAIQCAASAVPAGQALAPQLIYTSFFDQNGDGVPSLDEVRPVVVDGGTIGAVPVVGAALSGGALGLPALTSFNSVPVQAQLVVVGLDPATLPATLNLVVRESGSLLPIATGTAIPSSGGASITMTSGSVPFVSSASPGFPSSQQLAWELRVGTDPVATGVVTTTSRGIFAVQAASGGSIGASFQQWPGALAFNGAFLPGDETRVTIVSPNEPAASATRFALPTTVNAAGSLLASTTRSLPAGAWRACLSDQVGTFSEFGACSTFELGAPPTEIEPNDNDDTATAASAVQSGLDIGIPFVDAAVGGADVEDRFFFYVPLGFDHVRVETKGLCDPSMTLSLHARGSTTTTGFVTTSNGCPVLEADVLPGSVFVAQVGGLATAYSLSALLTPAPKCGDGRLDGTEQCDGFTGACSDVCVEADGSNDTFATADDITREPQPLTRALSPEGDVDVYRADVASGRRVNGNLVVVRQDSQPCNNLLRIELLDGTGAVAATSTNNAVSGCPELPIDVAGPAQLVYRISATSPVRVRYSTFISIPAGSFALVGLIDDDARFLSTLGPPAGDPAGVNLTTEGLEIAQGTLLFREIPALSGTTGNVSYEMLDLFGSGTRFLCQPPDLPQLTVCDPLAGGFNAASASWTTFGLGGPFRLRNEASGLFAVDQGSIIVMRSQPIDASLIPQSELLASGWFKASAFNPPEPLCGDSLVNGTETCDESIEGCAQCVEVAEQVESAAAPRGIAGTAAAATLTPLDVDFYTATIAGPTTISILPRDRPCSSLVQLEVDAPGGAQLIGQNVEPAGCPRVVVNDVGALAIRVRSNSSTEALRYALVLVSSCGNGVVDPGEGCDDGNTTSNDGCSATCAPEPGFLCQAPGTPCAQLFCEEASLKVALPAAKFQSLGAAGAFDPSFGFSAGGAGTTAFLQELGQIPFPQIVEVDADFLTPSSPADAAFLATRSVGSVGSDPNGFSIPAQAISARMSVQTPPLGTLQLFDEGASPVGSGSSFVPNNAGAHRLRITDDGFNVRAEWIDASQARIDSSIALLAAGGPRGVLVGAGNNVRLRNLRVCTTTAGALTSVCGNGVLEPGEQCDDGNASPIDGCSATCQLESGFVCPTIGLSCSSTGP